MSIFLVLCLSVSACTSASTAASGSSTATVLTNVSLRDLAQIHHLLIGSAVNVDALATDQTYATLLGQQFNVVTPENTMKFDATEPQEGVFNFTQADALVAFAQAHHMQVRGHNFVWYQALPAWLANGDFSRAQLMAILKNHITTVMKHYQGEVKI
jgi:endo-1,4-beta-xylanase